MVLGWPAATYSMVFGNNNNNNNTRHTQCVVTIIHTQYNRYAGDLHHDKKTI